jgi:hypothetical protein
MEWITQLTANNSAKLNQPFNHPCNSCVYNFYFDGRYQDSKSHVPTIELPGAIISPVHSDNHDNCPTETTNSAKNKPNESEYTMASYREAIRTMYRQPQNDKGEAPIKNKVYKMDDTIIPESRKIYNYVESPSSRMYYSATSEATRNSNYRVYNNINPDVMNRQNEFLQKHTNFNNYVHNNKPNYREAKVVDNKFNYRDENEVANKKPNYRDKKVIVKNNDKNNDYAHKQTNKNNNYYSYLTENKKTNIEDYFKTNQYEESGIPTKYLILYRMFLEEQQKLGNKKIHNM